jgi:hypothetical protein
MAIAEEFLSKNPTEHDLRALLSDDEFVAFSEARRTMKPFLATGNPERFNEFFGFSDFENLLNQTGIWTPDRLEAYLDTKKIPPQNLFAQIQLYGGARYRVVPENLQKVLRSGASLVLNDVDALSDGLRSLKSIITQYSGGKVESNLYYSQPRHQAFTVHFDVHEVFALQIEGRKRWRVYQQAHRFPINHLAFLSGDTAGHEKAKGPVSMEFVLEPGDLIFLPAGYYHQAVCTDSVSVHLSFSVVEMIGLDVVSELFDRGVLNEFFRTPVARAGDGELIVESYLKVLADNIEQLLTDEKFIDLIKQKLNSFPHPTGRVLINK